MVSPLPFTLDLSADHNSDGTSRYGNYLAQHQHLFRSDEPSIQNVARAQFALAAWRIANSPIMTPSYVQSHPRVLGSDVHWDEESRAAVSVRLALPMPAGLRRPEWRGWRWDRRAGWGDPVDNSRITALTGLTVRVPVPVDLLPTPLYRLGEAHTWMAKRAVGVLLEALNAEIGDLLADIELGSAG